MRKQIVNIAELELQPPQFAPTGPAAERYEARMAFIGPRIGAKKLGYNLTAVPARPAGRRRRIRSSTPERLSVSTKEPTEICEYPDTGKIAGFSSRSATGTASSRSGRIEPPAGSAENGHHPPEASHADLVAHALPSAPEPDVAAKGAIGDPANGHFGTSR